MKGSSIAGNGRDKRRTRKHSHDKPQPIHTHTHKKEKNKKRKEKKPLGRVREQNLKGDLVEGGVVEDGAGAARLAVAAHWLALELRS